MTQPPRLTFLLRLYLGLLAFLLLACASQADVMTNQLRFEQFNIDQGLSHESALAILQDKQGFMWIGTQAGLTRYDGYTAKVFKNVPGDIHSLSDTYVSALYLDEQGQLWVGTKGGLNRYDGEKQNFIRYFPEQSNSAVIANPSVNVIIGDKQGGIWLGTEDGLKHFFPQTGQFRAFSHDEYRVDSLINNQITSLARGLKGDLWIGTSAGLDRLPAGGEGASVFQHIRLDYRDQLNARATSILSLLITPTNTLWIGTGTGLQQLESGATMATRLKGGELDSLRAVPITALHLESHSDLWIGTETEGIKRLDTESNRLITYRYDDLDRQSLASNRITSFFKDRSGSLWIGTWYSGSSRVDLASGGFNRISTLLGDGGGLSNRQVRGIAEDEHGTLYFGTLDGLNRLDSTTGNMQVFRHNLEDIHSVSNSSVDVILPDSSGQWWIGTHAGLNRFDPLKGRFTLVDLANHFNGGNYIQSLVRDKHGHLWVASRGGLHRLTILTGDVMTFRHDPKDLDSIAENTVMKLLIDHQDRLWIATVNGLDLFDESTQHFRHFRNDPSNLTSLGHDRVHTLFEDSQGRLWVGTAGGLNLMESDANGVIQFRRFALFNDHKEEPIGAILEDSQGQLWISTTSGITRFDPVSHQFKEYKVEDGLIAGSFFINAAHKSRDGTMYFGGINGVSKFQPEAIRENPYPPQIAITDFLIFNQSVLSGKVPDGFVMHGALENLNELELSYKDSVFSLEFAALHFADPQRSHYAYQLQGFDKQWVYTDARKRFATYTNLDPGHYIFRLKASNKNGVWNDTGVSLGITITPPFWKTWWFRITLLALLFCLAYLLYRIRIRDLVAQKKVLEEEINARTREVVQQKETVEKQKLEVEMQKESVETANRNIAILSEIGRELTAKLDKEVIMTTLYSHVNELMDASVFGIGIYHPEQDVIEYPFAIERGLRYEQYVRNMSDPNQLAVWCIRNKKEVFINNLALEYRYYIDNLEQTSDIEHLGTLEDGSMPIVPRSMLYVPISLNDTVLGTICVQSFIENAYSHVHLDMLHTLATYVAVALDNADAYLRLELTQERLVEQEKLAALGALVAGVSHELNTPIGNCLLTASYQHDSTVEMNKKLLSSGVMKSELMSYMSKSQDASALIMRSLNSAVTLINSFKQVAVDRTSEQRRVYNLKQTCNEILETMKSKVYHSGHSIEIAIPAEIEVDGYPGAFGQVITNFVDNALLHAFDGIKNGKMQLSASLIPDNKVQIRFSDNGGGITENNLKLIFDPFFTTKLGQGGSGLGLNISYNIVTSLFGGHLEVQSKLGQGTTFIVDLPLTAPIQVI